MCALSHSTVEDYQSEENVHSYKTLVLNHRIWVKWVPPSLLSQSEMGDQVFELYLLSKNPTRCIMHSFGLMAAKSPLGRWSPIESPRRVD